MSFILKALKKLENEKAARQVGRVDINSAILEPARKTASSRRIPFLLMILLIIAAAAGKFIFVRHEAPLSVAEPEPKPSRTTAQVSKLLPEPSSATTEKMPDLPATTVISGERPVSDSEVVSPAVPVRKRQTQMSPIARKRSADKPATARHVESARSGEPPPLAAPPASLTVNGIALQDDPGKSIAVVNGTIVKKGMSVNGARVERIFLDRVRFSGNNGEFEVHLAR